MKARVSNLYKKESEWSRLNFIPLDGELVVYAPDAYCDYARIKVGGQKMPLQSLPFFATETYVDVKLTELAETTKADAGLITAYFPKGLE